MAKSSLMNVITWIVGIFVSLAVGSGMVQGRLPIPGIPEVLTMVAGWVVVIGAILSVIMALFNK